MDRRIADFGKELKKLDDDLLQSCRLTQDAISKASALLMRFDAQQAQEVADCNKNIGRLCAASREYFSGLIERDKPDGDILLSLSYGVRAVTEVKQIAGLTEAIVASLSGLNAGLPDQHKINAAQFAKIIRNIVRDAVFSFLNKDAALARKSVSAAARLRTVCIHVQENLLKADSPDESEANDETILIFIAQCLKNIAAHAADIAETALTA